MGFAGAVLRFFIIFNSNAGKDEPQTLHYAITQNCSMGADGGHPGRTTILIAHRLSTVPAVYEVAIIKGGRLVEQGHDPTQIAPFLLKFSECCFSLVCST